MGVAMSYSIQKSMRKKFDSEKNIGLTIALNELRAVSSNTSWKTSISEIVSYIGTSELSQLWNQEYLPRIKSVAALYLSSTRVNLSQIQFSPKFVH